MSAPPPPQVLSGKYRLDRELGRGGMGSVWLAQHLTLHSPVAIKLIDATIATNPEALSRFLREAQAAASLRSPHVVQILDHGVDNGVPFIVMELLDGESLAARIERVSRLSPQDTARIMTQVGRAMTKAHEAGVVHRDLKPDNIFLVRNDEEEIAKVLDFGIAKANTLGVASVSSATRTGSVLGTPYYMSPEQAEGAKGVDHRTDIWAMGVIACECLTGLRPFDAETLGAMLLAICAREMPVPSRLGPVPPAFDAWFARACSRDVNQRFSTAKEAAHELRSVCAGESMSAYAGSTVFGPPGAVQARSLPLSTTTGHLSLSAANQLPKNSTAPWVALGVLVLGAAAGAAFFALRASDPTNAAVSAAHVADAPPSEAPKTAATPALAAEPPKPASDATPAAATPVATASASARVAATPPAFHASAHAGAKPRVSAAVEKPAPAAAPAPAPATTAPAAKPRVNLGI
jgi:eukaryotic-like serine/threonine-protein kinase